MSSPLLHLPSYNMNIKESVASSDTAVLPSPPLPHFFSFLYDATLILSLPPPL